MDHNDIAILEKIGLSEVSRKTHIDVKQLEYIVHGEYDKLAKVKTTGFIKILSREYNIDFAQWLEGFNHYWSEHAKGVPEQQEKIFIKATPPQQPRKIFLVLVLALLVLGLGSVAYTFQNHLDFNELFNRVFSGNIEKNSVANNATTLSPSSVVQETATSLGVKVEERIVEGNGTNATTKKAIIVPIETNETNKTHSLNDTALVKNTPNSAILSPKRKIWVGIINLEDGTRKESIMDKNITIDLTKRQIIKTGNGYFELLYDGSKEDFTEQGSTRFLVEKGVVSKISEETFIKLNQGKNW